MVTGASGYLASALIHQLGSMDCHIVGLSRKNQIAFPESLKARISWIAGDICERDVWEQHLEGAHLVFHFAGQTSAYAAEQNPDFDYTINVLPMLHLGEVCRKKGYHPGVLFSGTVTQSGIPESFPVHENVMDLPMTYYDLHKSMAEQYLKFYTRLGVLSGVSLRLPNIYGPGPTEGNLDRGVLNKMVRRALEGKPLILYTEGEEMRDYLYIEDAMSAFLLAGAIMEKVKGRHFILGSGQPHSIKDAFDLVSQRAALKTERRVPLERQTPPEPLLSIEKRNFVADFTQFSKISGWRPRYSLTQGIDQTLESLL